MTDQPSKYRVWIYLLVSAGAVVAGLFIYQFFFRHPIWATRTFKSSSSSMCPTVCKGEHIFVQMFYGAPYSPKRDDVILFQYSDQPAPYIKRVIGLPGDTVAPGAGNKILVNGKPWQPPEVCAKSLLPWASSDNTPLISFPVTKVPNGQIFVIGDNLNNSFDSRIDGFKPVTPQQVLGKPYMISWSPESSRLGCPVR